MKTLLVLRHAKSSWKDTGLDDHDRPLNKRGKKTAPLMGQLIKDEQIVPDLMISSTALRAKTTAEAVAKSSKYSGNIQIDSRLYLAGIHAMVRLLQEIPSDTIDRVMLVGHNPGQEDLIRELTGQDERFPTAALAQIELPIQRWSDMEAETEGKLVNIWRPKEVEAPAEGS
jgi:phosphohistidine phosphatase